MDATTLLLAVLGIYGTGIATKAGHETFETIRQLVKHKLTGTSTGKALNEGEDPDPCQAVIDVEAIAQDPEIEQLLQQIKRLLSQNEELKQQIESAQKRLQKNIQINKDNSQEYQFNDKVKAQSIGGIHYHD
ncbi:MAG: hypothetical protein QNJ42_06755 [Crocosphaera sp.]|nr:hypothetical protein [Crocosphaera sp.]